MSLFKSVSLRKNISANIVGSVWTGLINIAFVPLYIKLMGPEAYGIVGIFTSLVGVFSVLDLGLSVSLNRELARLHVEPSNREKMAATIKTLETIYWLAAALITFITLSASHFLAYKWVNPEKLSHSSMQTAFVIMSAVLGLRWPVALYTGGLNGLQRQVLVNALSITTVTIQNVGAWMVLAFLSPTIEYFFVWQAIIALVQVLAFRISLKFCIGKTTPTSFNKEIIKDIWRFAAGMSGVAILATILTQLDKIILSKTLSLKEFGYYTFAATIAAGIYKICTPVFTAYYPKLVELIERKNQTLLISTYHQGCQLLSLLILPTSIVLAFFSKEILELWTRNPELVSQTSTLFTLLLIGNTLNGIMNMPGALQMAYGWTRLIIYSNIIAVIVLAPAIYFAVNAWGAVGAAMVWIILNFGYLTVQIYFMHRRLLRTELIRYYGRDLALPFLAAIAVASLGRFAAPSSMGKLEAILFIGTVSFLTFIASAFSIKFVREKILQRL